MVLERHTNYNAIKFICQLKFIILSLVIPFLCLSQHGKLNLTREWDINQKEKHSSQKTHLLNKYSLLQINDKSGMMAKKYNQNQTKNNKVELCFGCGAEVIKFDGPVHSYIGASPGCWAVFSEVLEREYKEYNYPPVHHLTVNTYASQHPGRPSRQSIQSVAVHLIGLHLMLDLNFSADRTMEIIGRAAQKPKDFHWLEPPSTMGGLTILDVYKTKNLKDHTDRVHIWAHAVWQAWQHHHEQIRAWAKFDE